MPFNLRQICEADQRMSYDYAFGYLVAANSAGFLFNASVGDIVRIEAYAENVAQELEAAIQGRLEFLRNNGRSKDADDFKADIKKIERVFT